MSKIDVKSHCIHPSRSGFKETLVFCLLLACFSVMLAQPGFEQTAIAETYGFEEDATLNDYDLVPSGTAYGPSPGFYFTRFYFLAGASLLTLNGTDDFYTDQRASGSDQAWFVTSDGSEVNIVRMDIAAWAVTGFLNPDDDILIEGLRNGSQIYSTTYTFAARNIMYTVTLNWNNIDQIRFTGVDPSALAELQVEMDNLVFETPPFVQSINRADPNPTNASSVDYTVTFSEGVTGADATDFSLATSGVSGASITSVSGSGDARTVTVNTGSGDGTLRLDLVDDDTIQDGDGNPLGGTGAGNGNFTGQTYTIDKTGPTVSIGAPSVSDTNTGPVIYTVTYTGADTVNLTTGDVTLNKTGTADGIVSVSNGTTTTPTVTISSITGDGTLGISIAPGTSSDTAGNTDAGAGPSATFIVDNTPPPPPSTPDLLASSDTGSSDTDDITSDTTPDFTGTAEVNSTVELSSDIDGPVGTGTAASNWTITASTLSEGTHNITATATDAVGKTSLPSPALSLTIDTVPPVVSSIVRADPNPTSASSVDFTVTFSEDVSDVDTGDFDLTVTGSVTGTVDSVTASSVATVTVGSITGNGTLRLDVDDNDSITDTAGNPLGGAGIGNGSYTAGEAYTIDNTPPTVSIGPPSVFVTDTGPVNYIVTYTGADTVNLTSGGVTLNKTGTADGTVSVSNGTTATPTVTISSITGDGTLGISIAPGTSSDTAGNTDAGAGPSATFIVDNTPPPPPSTPDLLASSDTGSSDTDDITSDTTPDFTGTAEVNSTVELSSDIDGPVGTGTAASNWTITASTLSEGTHNITATATDAVGKTSLPSPALSVIITLNPVARDDQYTTNENTTLNVPAPGVLGNDVDVHGNALMVQSVDTTGTIGLVSMNPDGSFTYTPAGGFAGYDSFTYVVMEGGDGTDTGTVSITVNCRNQRSIKIKALDFVLDGTTLSGSFSMKNDSKRSHDAQVIGTQIGLECRPKKEKKKKTEWMEIETGNHVFTPAPPVVFSDDLIIAFTCDLMEAIPDGAKSLRVTSTVEVFGAKKSFVFRSSQEPPSSGASFFAPARLSVVPEKTTLGQNFRNPFNPDTWIPYQLARDVNVTIRIYSIPGRLIRTLDLGRKPAGFYTTKDRAAYWDGRNEAGESVTSGIYFYQIQAGEFSATRKMTILK